MTQRKNTQIPGWFASWGGSPKTPSGRLLFGLYATFCILVVAVAFWQQMRLQLAYAQFRDGGALGPTLSAPLDDVFIYFDYARSAASGHPGEWAEGNGYSSGGTSLLYPLVLAFGYALGFTGDQLMLWAGVVACVSLLVFLRNGARLHDSLPSYSPYLLPPLALGIGGLSWSLFSGMEVAFFLAVWGIALYRWLELNHTLASDSQNGVSSQRLLLGLACAALAATRPEAAVLVAVFSVSAAFTHLKKSGWLEATSTLLVTAVPGALVVIGQAIANRVLTGEWSAAGAVAKLEMHHPFMTAEQVFDAWWFHMRYQVDRLSLHHLAQPIEVAGIRLVGIGYGFWALAAIPFFSKKTRGAAALLWASALLWTCVVALNGQVRWQNERYSMPALALLLLSGSLGLSIAIQAVLQAKRNARPIYGALLALSLALLFSGQLPQFRDQLWFFGRATRNIHEQHVATAKRIRHEAGNERRRVLVGDAGAIPYVSEQPALDLIGLGGYHDFPFARANRFGMPAAVELIGRLPIEDRPKLLALYPSWWGDLVTWFGTPLYGLSARGNVICGGLTKMVYKPDWSPLDHSDVPFSLKAHQAVLGRLDFAELMSEKDAELKMVGTDGHVSMKMLAHPRSPRHDLWDAGRGMHTGTRAEFALDLPAGSREVVVRLAPAHPISLAIAWQSEVGPAIDVPPGDTWQEIRFPIDDQLVGDRVPGHLEITAGHGVIYQLWIVEGSAEPSAASESLR